MLLIVDLETSGLMIPGLPPEAPEQPWPVQVAADLCDEEGNSLSHMSIRIKSDGRKIDPGATAVHGITSREADKTGVSEVVALAMLVGLVGDAEKVIGFGVNYDKGVILGALTRWERPTRKFLRPGLEFVDLIPPAAAACKLPTDHSSNSFRWPDLSTAFSMLTNGLATVDDIDLPAAHDAWGDCRRAKAVYFALKARNLILEVA